MDSEKKQHLAELMTLSFILGTPETCKAYEVYFTENFELTDDEDILEEMSNLADENGYKSVLELIGEEYFAKNRGSFGKERDACSEGIEKYFKEKELV